MLFPLVIIAYLCLVGIILFAAFRHRRPGWWAGALFGAMLLTMPLWVALLMAIVTPWLPPTSNTSLPAIRAN